MMPVARPAAWDGGVCPFAAGWQRVLMWWFIVGDGLLFGAFLAAYGYARLIATTWPDSSVVFSLPYLAAMTLVLNTSSAMMASGVAAARRGAWPTARRWLLATTLGGVLFLGMQADEWRHAIAAGARLSGNPWGDASFGAYFFLITGFHGTHVLLGVLILTIATARVATRRATPLGIELVGLYWHFVELVWVFVFTLFYLL